MKKHLIPAFQFHYILLLVLFLASILSSTAQALLPGDYLGNNIYFYSPSAKTACRADSATTRLDLPSLVGNDNAEKIWRFLIDKGLTAEQAAGVMGNIQQESNFDPAALEGNGIGYGIVQWSFGRRTALEKAASDQGVSVSDLSFQLAYMHQESMSRQVSGDVEKQGYGKAGDNEWETLKKQKTVEDATVFWHNNFEVSADTPEQVLANRGSFAQNAFNSFKNLATPVAVPEAGSGGLRPRDDCGDSNFAGGDLAQTVLAYAWPEYHDAPYIEMKPAYAEAVKKAQAEGRGVGGIQHPGIDCAGFVSLLIVDSGFDPEYNTKGTYAAPAPGYTGEAIQRYWMQENWTKLGVGGSSSINVADLRPGDVAVTYGATATQHIFIYVGQIDGFGNVFASASLDERAPMAAGSYENATSSEYEWYRKR